MIEKIFCKYARLEMISRRILHKLHFIKNRIKKYYKSNSDTKTYTFDKEGWEVYRDHLVDLLEPDDIVLIHSSMDGMRILGVDEAVICDLITDLVKNDITVVLPTFPISNLHITNNRMKTYNPAITPCWTGMLPNKFLTLDGVVRSKFPYNSLAAIGKYAKEMMNLSQNEKFVYGESTPWHYCMNNHAKIIFIGTSSAESNTMQTHMLADYMGDDWPVENWYDQISAPIKDEGFVFEKKIMVQKAFWMQFVVDYHTSQMLANQGVLYETTISKCKFGIIKDAYEMMRFLEKQCRKGHMNYMIPRKYYKKKKGRKNAQ